MRKFIACPSARVPFTRPWRHAARAYAPAVPDSRRRAAETPSTSFSQFPLPIGTVAVWWVNPELVRSTLAFQLHE